MKVLFFTNIPSPYRVDFFNELGKFCDLTVLYERSDADDRDASWLKCGEQSNYKSVFLKGNKFGADSAFCMEVISYWKDPAYDIRIVGDFATPTGILSIAYLKAKKIPFGVELDGGFEKNENKLISFVKKWLLSGCAFAFSPGQVTDRYLLRYGVDQKKIIRYNFTSLREEDIINAAKHRSNKQQYKEIHHITENYMILSVGQMIYRKGFDVLLKAIATGKIAAGVYIIGGAASDECLKLTEELKLDNVHFLQFMSKEDLAAYYAAADLFVLPTREDIWGLVIQEAMSYGLPIVTTDKCGAGLELVHARGGSIVQADNVDALASALKNLMVDRKKATVYSQQNLSNIRDYTIENMAQQHAAAFEKIKGNGYEI